MFAKTDFITIMFGGLGGLAALIVAINTFLLRRETRSQARIDANTSNRMETFETSQLSLQAALVRADLENERLRAHMETQDIEIDNLKKEVATLKDQVERLTDARRR